MDLVEFVKRDDSFTIVPKEEFIRAISASTGWSEQVLQTKDMGQIEEKLNLRLVKPTQSDGLKRGKSMSELYKFEGFHTRKRNQQELNKILK